MNIGQAEKQLKQQLRALYEAGESDAIAAIVLEDCTGYFRSELAIRREQELAREAEEKLTAVLHRLLQHEPVQYVLAKTWFYGMELYVDKAVLIPRPETEELVDWIAKDIKTAGMDVFQKPATDADATTQLKILDIGTGSGCIALALKKAMPRAEVWGCDVSEEALNVARRNGSALDIRVDFQGVNFLDEAQQRLLPTVDIIVSNPPYVPLREKADMDPNVVNFEPHTALFVPNDDALLFYKAILSFAEKRLYEGGSIYLEIHENLSEAVRRLFEEGGYAVQIRTDMQGKPRMVKAARQRAA